MELLCRFLFWYCGTIQIWIAVFYFGTIQIALFSIRVKSLARGLHDGSRPRKITAGVGSGGGESKVGGVAGGGGGVA